MKENKTISVQRPFPWPAGLIFVGWIFFFFPAAGWGARTDPPDPFAQQVLRWGHRFKKALGREWEMALTRSTLVQLDWHTAPQTGYRIRFIHQHQRVPVPEPFPQKDAKKRAVQVLPLRCSLHFYPREGSYRAYKSWIQRGVPAQLVAVTQGAIVFQPDYFLAREYPCPGLMRQFHRLHRAETKGREVTRQVQRWVGGKNRVRQARLFRYHLWIQTRSRRPLPLLMLARRLRIYTVVIEINNAQGQFVEIEHPQGPAPLPQKTPRP